MAEEQDQSTEEGEDQPEEAQSAREQLGETVGAKEERKLFARSHDTEVVWFGLGMMGLVGWSVAIPTILGVLLGLYLDRVVPVSFSWTLTLLFAGIVIGCLNAWYWVNQEADEIGQQCMPEPDEQQPPEDGADGEQ